MNAKLKAVPDLETIHIRHSVDGYPLCWPMDQDGVFYSVPDIEGSDCQECIAILQEDD